MSAFERPHSSGQWPNGIEAILGAGFRRDELGGYNLAFLLLAGLNFLGAVLFLIARKPKLPGLVRSEAAA